MRFWRFFRLSENDARHICFDLACLIFFPRWFLTFLSFQVKAYNLINLSKTGTISYNRLLNFYVWSFNPLHIHLFSVFNLLPGKVKIWFLPLFDIAIWTTPIIKPEMVWKLFEALQTFLVLNGITGGVKCRFDRIPQPKKVGFISILWENMSDRQTCEGCKVQWPHSQNSSNPGCT